jgi:CheY-like chemotaxis protein
MAKTLLLADDSVTIQKVVSISFASEDVTLVTVDNGDDAVERAKETRPDLILADVIMPGKSGYEVCEAVKADPDLAHIPVLLLTGTFEAFDEERASRAGAAGHVAKPFEAQTLVNQVNRLLAEAPPPAAAQAPAPVAPPDAVTTPAPGVAESSESFDFFDDDLGDLASPEAAAAESDAVSFGDSDSAFAFGDEDLAPAAAEPVREQAAPPPAPSQAFGATFDEPPIPDRTVAILPDDVGPAEPLPAQPAPAPPEEVPPTVLSEYLDDSGFGAENDEMIAIPESEPEDSFAPINPSATSEEVFDFTFEGEPAIAEPIAVESIAVEPAIAEPVAVESIAVEPAIAEPVAVESIAVEPAIAEPAAVEPSAGDDPMGVEAVDLAQATVLDPSGASDYDVSSSDLGDPFAAEPLGEGAEPADAMRPMDSPAVMDEPVAAAEFPGIDDFGEELESAVFEPEEEPAAFLQEIEPSAAPESAFELGAAPVREAARPLPDEPAERADSVLSEIAPTLRAEIHDTLEKIAWESFGDVTEKIVAEAVDRVEKIAWEVIPQLAETLIKDEIRRLKGEDDG